MNRKSFLPTFFLMTFLFANPALQPGFEKPVQPVAESLSGRSNVLLPFILDSHSPSSPAPRPIGTAPYPPSRAIAGISFDWSTYKQMAAGSDNWAVTWADDNHQYTTWGDGGGFGGSNDDGRVSLGFARVEGGKESYTGHNVWGGKNSESPARFEGKSRGILSIEGVLYMWRCGDGSNSAAYKFQQLYRSSDHARNWSFTGVEFNPDSFPGTDHGFFCPAFLQFGRDYQGARDGYVYIYAPENQANQWEVQKPGEIALLRVPKSGLEELGQYEYFAGQDSLSRPVWTREIARRQPVFADRKNGVMRTSVSYNAGLKRYFLITEHTELFEGNIGIYDAPEPWGPWTTVLFGTRFGSPHIQPDTFYWNFSNKWLSPDGKNFVLVFTGINELDAWNTVEGVLQPFR